MRILRILTGLMVVIIALLVGCEQVETPSPVTVTPPENEKVTPDPVPTLTATAFAVTPSMTPAFIYAPDTGEPIYPLSDLRILSPGEGSRLSSPIRPELSILLGAENTVEVELLNSSGALLVKKLLQYSQISSSQRILIQPEMDFEIAGDEEAGRLVVKTYDNYGRLIALTSCDFTLLADGVSIFEAARVPYESFLLTEPRAGSVIQDDVVTVSGYARPVSQSAIVIELVDENGSEISNRVFYLTGDPGGAPVIFNATLPYQVERETAVRLILRQAKGTFPGPAVASSLLLIIK